MDEINIENICVILETQMNVLKKLLEAEKEKSVVLEKVGADGLDAIMNKEQALIMECSAAEKRRMSLCEKLGVSTISELVAKYPEYSEKIVPLRDQMLSLTEKIKKIGDLNSRLLDTRLKLIRFMSAKLGASDETVSYGKELKH